MTQYLPSKLQQIVLASALSIASLSAYAISDKAAAQGVPTLAPMLKEVTPAVVSIRVQKSQSLPTQFQFNGRGNGRDGRSIPENLRRFFDSQPNQGQGGERPYAIGSGSGVIIDADNGYVVTNHHVVSGADSITVTLSDGTQLEGTLLGSDERTDVAVLEIQTGSLTDIAFADIDTVDVGDYVVAIGNPFGIGQTVTSGIVSALGRAGINNANYEDFIQTDASINVGNSGGALIDMEGHLVGVNTAIISGNGGSNGIGFAIPVNMISSVVGHLVRDGEVRRGILGITMRDVTSDLATALNIDVDKGVIITNVLPASGAEKAGVQVSDVVLAVNGESVNDSREIRNTVGLMRLNEEVDLELLRNGKRLNLTATIAANPTQASRTGDRPASYPSYAGARLRSYNSGDVEGVELVAVTENSNAWSAGLREGDVIVQVNRQTVEDLAEFNAAVDGEDDLTALTVLREGREMLIFLS